MDIMTWQREQADDLLAHIEDSLRNGDFTMTEIVKEANFNDPEDDFRTVRLSAHYAGWDSALLLATFRRVYKCNFQRVENRQVTTWEMSIAEMDALCEAWAQFKTDLEKHNSIE